MSKFEENFERIFGSKDETRCNECRSRNIITRHFTVDTHMGDVDKMRIECRECGEDEVVQCG